MILLDFDGVLFDSAVEAHVVGTMTRKGCSRQAAMKGADRFCRFRYLVSGPEDVLVISQTLETHTDATVAVIESSFHEMREQLLEAAASQFRADFFACRADLRKNDPEGWVEVQPPYPFFHNIRPFIQANPDAFCIVSTKDEPTLAYLLEAHGTPISTDRIFGSEAVSQYGTKRAVIEAVMKDHRIDRAIFVDDHRKHLYSCADIRGLRTVQPDWGYIAPNDDAIGCDEVLALLKTYLPDQ